MNMTADIVIIGAGSTGTSVAWHLAKKKAGKIIVIEKTGPGSGATGHAAGLIRHHYVDKSIVEMAMYSSKKLENFQDEMGFGIDYVKNGFCYFEKKSAKEMAEVIAMQKACGVELEVLSEEQIRHLHPRGTINPDGVGCALYDSDGAYADPYKLAVGYGQRAKDLGVTFLNGVEALSVITECNRVTGVSTQKGNIYCSTVINCAGLGAGRFCDVERTGVNLYYMPLGHMVLIPDRPFEEGIVTICDASVPADMFFIRPESGGTVLLGSDIDETRDKIQPETYYQKASHERIASYFESMVKRMPFVANYRYQTSFGALDMRTADWNPGLGYLKNDVEGLYHAIGGSGHCFKLAPMLGTYISAEILGEEIPFDRQIFDINRLCGMKDMEGSFFIDADE